MPSTDSIGIAHGNLVEGNRVFAIGTLTCHIDHCLHTGLLIGRHPTNQTGTTDIGTWHHAALTALEGNLAFDGDTDRILEHRAAAHLHDIVRLKGEARLISQ